MRRINYRGFSAVEALLLIILVGLTGGVGYYVYQSSNQTQSAATRDTGLAGEQQKEEPAKKVEVSSSAQNNASEESLIATAEAHCEAKVNSVFRLGTTGPNRKQVEYSEDKKFAHLNAGCGELNCEGCSALYTLKLANDRWTVIHVGQDAGIPNPERYGYPAGF